MKKYMYYALALPLLFACSSDDLLDKEVVSNDQFAGIEKVDAIFSMDEGGNTRFDGKDGEAAWSPEEGDVWGFAWMGDGTKITVDGMAYQNHNLIQNGSYFEPQTSIYVGKYFLYRPYDVTTVSPQAINFNSLVEQTVDEGFESSKQPWKDLAKTAINIGDKWTNVTTTGTTISGETWDKAGIKQKYQLNAALFSNQTGLDLTYKKNNVAFTVDKTISGATDIEFNAKGSSIGAADIYGGTVELEGAAKSFTYAPTAEPNTGDHSGSFWADKKNLSGTGSTITGFNFTSGAITLKAKDAENGISTNAEGSKGWFWFNSLPVTAGNGTEATKVTTILNTSYGDVTVTNTVKDCAYAGNVESKVMVWHPLADAADATKTPTVWAIGANNTFINQYGNHKGKYVQEVDFSKGVMNGMHIKNDTHLQKALKYYLASGKNETVRLLLDAASATDKTFKLSKISIALIQTINTTVGFDKVLIKACTDHGTPKIIITQDGQTELSLADKKEVPALNGVFQTAGTKVYLSKDCEWTWGGGADGKTALPVDAAIASITNEGTLTVNATNIAMVNGTTLQGVLENAAGATMNITQVTTVKNALTNLGTINVGSASNKTAELRAYDVAINNDATALDACGVINNYGVVGVTDGTAGTFNNYGLIDMKDGKAITLLTTNEIGTKPFGTPFAAATNKMGTVVLPDGNPTAIVSVNNADANGFIKYTWPATTSTYETPAGNVKYNTIVVSGDIEFTEKETEIQYIEFDGTRTQVVNPGGLLTNLKGIIVNPGKSIIIEKGNRLAPKVGAFLGEGATIYNGGDLTLPTGATTNYFGTWSTDQIVKY